MARLRDAVLAVALATGGAGCATFCDECDDFPIARWSWRLRNDARFVHRPTAEQDADAGPVGRHLRPRLHLPVQSASPPTPAR